MTTPDAATAGCSPGRPCSASLTLAAIAGAMETIKKSGPVFNWLVVKPGLREWLRRNSPPATGPQWLGCGMVIYEKQQAADSWAFADESLLRKYLAGELSELDLMHKCFDGAGCKPNDRDHR